MLLVKASADVHCKNKDGCALALIASQLLDALCFLTV